MDQIKQLKDMRDAARARVEASVDYQVAQRLDAMISDLESVFGEASETGDAADEEDKPSSLSPFPSADDEFEVAVAQAEAEADAKQEPAPSLAAAAPAVAAVSPVTPFPSSPAPPTQLAGLQPTASDQDMDMDMDMDMDDTDIVASALEDLSLDGDDEEASKPASGFPRPGIARGLG